MSVVSFMEVDEFVLAEGLDPNDNSKDTTSISINANKLKYIKYLSYRTGFSVSKIIESLLCINIEEIGDNDEGNIYGCTGPDNKTVAMSNRLIDILNK